MTVLLTGAAGTIGSALRERLPDYGWQLRGFDRVRRAAAGSSATSRRPADLDAALDGVEAIVHLAGQPAEAPWPVIREANIEGTLQVFEAARRAGVRRVVYASSNHAVGFTPGARRAAGRPAAAAGHALRRQQGVRRGAGPLLRRPLRDAGGVPAHRHLRATARRMRGR